MSAQTDTVVFTCERCGRKVERPEAYYRVPICYECRSRKTGVKP